MKFQSRIDIFHSCMQNQFEAGPMGRLLEVSNNGFWGLIAATSGGKERGRDWRHFGG